MLLFEGPETPHAEAELPSQAVRPRKLSKFDRNACFLQIRLNTFEEPEPDAEVSCKREKKKSVRLKSGSVKVKEPNYCEDKKKEKKKKQRCSCKEGLGNRLDKVAAWRSTTAIDLYA